MRGDAPGSAHMYVDGVSMVEIVGERVDVISVPIVKLKKSVKERETFASAGRTKSETLEAKPNSS
jgi:hypothetical protein